MLLLLLLFEPLLLLIVFLLELLELTLLLLFKLLVLLLQLLLLSLIGLLLLTPWIALFELLALLDLLLFDLLALLVLLVPQILKFLLVLLLELRVVIVAARIAGPRRRRTVVVGPGIPRVCRGVPRPVALVRLTGNVWRRWPIGIVRPGHRRILCRSLPDGGRHLDVGPSRLNVLRLCPSHLRNRWRPAAILANNFLLLDKGNRRWRRRHLGHYRTAENRRGRPDAGFGSGTKDAALLGSNRGRDWRDGR